MNEGQEIFEQIEKENDIFKKARLISFLKKEKNFSLKFIAQKTGLKSSYLCHLLRLLRLPPLVIDGYLAKLISLSHLFILSRLKDKKEILAVYEKILAENLNTKKTQELVESILYKLKPAGEKIEEKIREKIVAKFKKINPQAKVKIYQSQRRAKLEIIVEGNRKETSDFLRKIVNED